MSDGMAHEQAREALEALALDALDASERDGVMAHVATCAICQSELAALAHTASDRMNRAIDSSMFWDTERTRDTNRVVARNPRWTPTCLELHDSKRSLCDGSSGAPTRARKPESFEAREARTGG